MTRRATLAGRIAIVTTLVAAAAVLIAGLVSLPLIRSSAESQARSTLARQADLVQQILDRNATTPAQKRTRVAALLRGQSITTYIVSSGNDANAPISPEQSSALLSGQSVSVVTRASLSRSFVEGRPLDDGTAVVLAQPASVARAADESGLLRRFGFALLVGLAVAAVAGVLLARWLSGPLRRTADGAKALASGHRDVRIQPDGPAEVAEVADAINVLAAELNSSEGRQRDFLLSVSHELRTPLTAVRGYAEALADGVVTPDQVAATGKTMLDEATRLDRLVADLLDLARMGAVDFRLDSRPLDLSELMRQTAHVWSTRCAADDVKFQSQIPDAALLVTTDGIRVRQIVDNLMDNALRVTPAQSWIVLRLRSEGTHAAIEVVDGGPGLTPEDRGVAFEPGELNRRYRGVRQVGSGIGLALVGRLSSRLGGLAEVDAAPGGGSCFRVWLPLR
jgi:two-component system, OmpR family, sensor kinase